MLDQNKITDAVAKIYDWLDSQDDLKKDTPCKACGQCCDFDSFDHRLFVTAPELIYFSDKLKQQNIKPAPTSRCPYNVAGRCTVYQHRFAGCRIFSCRSDTGSQAELSEKALEKFKSICKDFDIPYRYTDLPTALNTYF